MAYTLDELLEHICDCISDWPTDDLTNLFNEILGTRLRSTSDNTWIDE